VLDSDSTSLAAQGWLEDVSKVKQAGVWCGFRVMMMAGQPNTCILGSRF
jgi:hypothetical protein